MSDIYRCPTCGHHTNLFTVGLTAGLIHTLAAFKCAVLAKNRNSIHIAKDINLSYSQRANFSKLRVHGLVAKDDKAGAGYWLLTHRGSEFLKGNQRIPATVKTLNNEVVWRDDSYVGIRDILGTVPYFEDIESIERERLPIEVSQQEMVL